MNDDTKGRTILGTTAPGAPQRSTPGVPQPMPPHAAPRASLPIPVVTPASSMPIPTARFLVDMAYTKLELGRLDEAFDALESALCLDLSLSGHVSRTVGSV